MAARAERGLEELGTLGVRGCLEPGCGRAAEVASRYCRLHGDGEVARAERRAAARLLGDLQGAALGGPGEGPERRAAELWRRAARGDYGELLEERLGEVMAAGEVGRVRGLLGQLVGALAISLDEVMTGEAGPQERSLAVSRLAHAATRVVATRRAEVALAADADRAAASQALMGLLEELDAELDDYKQGVGERQVETWRSTYEVPPGLVPCRSYPSGPSRVNRRPVGAGLPCPAAHREVRRREQGTASGCPYQRRPTHESRSTRH